jgi:hypothetical protein
LPRRRCDLCSADPFLACSSRCLDSHIAGAHADHARATSAERARLFYRDLNRRFPDTSESYTEHRERMMALATSVADARRICVLGAGNCSDVDLVRLAGAFEQIDLVDLDSEALARASERSPAHVRPKLTTHGGVDFSGMIDRLDAWGDSFPKTEELAMHALSAAHDIVRQIGATFDVTLSTCVLSQLPIPFQRAWIMRESSWANLIGAIRAVHLATLAGVTRPGGTGVLVFDALSSREVPEIASLDVDAVEIDQEVSRRGWSLHPDPRALLREMQGLSSLVREPQLAGPWLWNLGEATQLVYAIVFRRS